MDSPATGQPKIKIADTRRKSTRNSRENRWEDAQQGAADSGERVRVVTQAWESCSWAESVSKPARRLSPTLAHLFWISLSGDVLGNDSCVQFPAPGPAGAVFDMRHIWDGAEFGAYLQTSLPLADKRRSTCGFTDVPTCNPLCIPTTRF